MPAAKKPTLGDRFYEILEGLFRELDQAEIRREVDALRKRHPRASSASLSRMLIRRAALRTASVGAAAGVAGGPWALLAMAPDIFNLVREESRLVLSIAFLHGRRPSLKERFREVLAVLAASTGSSIARQSARRLIARGLESRAARSIVRRVAGRMMARRLPAAVPVIGTVLGGTMNYYSVKAVGEAAIRFYSESEPTDAPKSASRPGRKKVRLRISKRTRG